MYLRLRVSKWATQRMVHTFQPQQTLWSFMNQDTSAYDYATCYSQPEPPALQKIRLAACAANPIEAQKMISPLQGAFMSSLVRAQQPKRILELGCYIGYSALWLAHGLQHKTSANAHLWTCEREPEIAALARQNVDMAGYKDTVTVLAQPAETALAEWDSTNKLDMIFIDANKSAYKKYYDLILERDLLSAHGQIIVDNVLFHGKVHTEHHGKSDPPLKKSRIAAKIHEFNKHVASDPRTFQVVLPIFDGLMVISKVV